MKPSPAILATLENIQDQMHLRILACHELTIDHGWNVRNVQSGFWRLYFNLDTGAGIHLTKGLYPLTTNRIHLIPAGVRFSCQCSRRVRHLYIHFELMGLPIVMMRQMFDRPLTLAPDTLSEQLAGRLSETIKRHQQAADDSHLGAMAKSLVYFALGTQLEHMRGTWSEQMIAIRNRTQAIRPALEYVEEHLSDALDNDILAAQCQLCRDHFARRFKSIMGQTPARYVLQRRIEQATQNLVFTELSIDDIASRHGFANRFHFTRVFTRQMHVAPATYRKQRHV